MISLAPGPPGGPGTLAMPGPILTMRGMTKRFGPLLAADRIDLDLNRGEVLALLGENGAGKTTLMNMLFGEYTPDAGEVRIRDPGGNEEVLPPGQPQAAIAARVGMVHQHFTLAENLSVLDNILLGTEPLFSPRRSRRRARARLNRLMKASGLNAPLDVRIRDLSVGERQRVEILKALYREARILVLDEPTAVLTPQEADSLFAAIRALVRDGLSVIFISHKLREVLAFSDRIMVLRHGRRMGEMPTAEADAGRIVRMMVGEEHARVDRTPGEPGAPALTLTEVSVPASRAHRGLFDLSLTIHKREILGIAGVAGNGQSTLARIISGLLQPGEGSISIGGKDVRRLTPARALREGIGRIPEDRHRDGIVADMSVAENLVIERLDSPEVQRQGILRRAAIATHARALVDAHDIRGPGPQARTALLSGGNIQKLILARVLEAQPGIILANQPTRGLDVRAASEVSRRLIEARDRGAGVLFISEDLDEILTLSDRILVMHNGRVAETKLRDRAVIGAMMTGGASR